jgi:hypothetical protein
VPLLFLARQQYVMALTDRRVLIFRRSRKPSPKDLVMGKRYESFDLEGVRRRRFLMQVMVRAANGNRQVFEFRPGQRDLGGELIARLTPSFVAPLDTTDPGTQFPDLAPFDTRAAEPAPTASPAETEAGETVASDDAPSESAPSESAPSESAPSESADPIATEFWGNK